MIGTRAAIAAAAVVLGGCTCRLCDMDEQPKRPPATPSPFFADGTSSRLPPAGSVVRAKGDLAATSGGRLGADAVAQDVAARRADRLPDRPSAALLARGRERYGIYCLPCHGAGGDGDGPVVGRGFPAPPSYHADRLRAAPDRHFFDVITGGYGVMLPYADRVAPADRWAIAAYVRALQLSRRAPVAELPAALQAALAASAPARSTQ